MYLLMQSRHPSVKCRADGELLYGRRKTAVRVSHPAAENTDPASLLFGITGIRRYFILKTKTTEKIKLLCLTGIMAAMFVGLDVLAVSISAPFGGNLKISLSGLPVLIVSIFGGPLWGGMTGFLGAFIGQLITYGLSATTVLWIIPAVARGVIMGLLFRAFRRSLAPGILILETCITSVAVTLLNTAAMLLEQKLYGYYQSYLAIYGAIPARLLAGIITAVIFSFMLPTIVNTLKKQKIADF